MTRTVTATEANQHISEIMREVRAGETVTVTSRGKPILHMVPAEKPLRKKPDWDALWAKMDEMNGIVIGPWTRDELYDR
jgi:prevent-host-death family protein